MRTTETIKISDLKLKMKKHKSKIFYVAFQILCVLVAIGALILYLVQDSTCDNNINASFNLQRNEMLDKNCKETTSTKSLVEDTNEQDLKVLGDGICDDDFNTEFYGYDQGDCCDATSTRDLCQECRCPAELIYQNSNR